MFNLEGIVLDLRKGNEREKKGCDEFYRCFIHLLKGYIDLTFLNCSFFVFIFVFHNEYVSLSQGNIYILLNNMLCLIIINYIYFHVIGFHIFILLSYKNCFYGID